MLVCVYVIIGIPKSKAEILENWHNNIHLGPGSQGRQPAGPAGQSQDAFKAEADAVIERMKDAMAQGRNRV